MFMVLEFDSWYILDIYKCLIIKKNDIKNV